MAIVHGYQLSGRFLAELVLLGEVDPSFVAQIPTLINYPAGDSSQLLDLWISTFPSDADALDAADFYCTDALLLNDGLRNRVEAAILSKFDLATLLVELISTPNNSVQGLTPKSKLIVAETVICLGTPSEQAVQTDAVGVLSTMIKRYHRKAKKIKSAMLYCNAASSLPSLPVDLVKLVGSYVSGFDQVHVPVPIGTIGTLGTTRKQPSRVVKTTKRLKPSMGVY